MITGTRRPELVNMFARVLSPVSNRVENIRYEFHPPDDFSRDMGITIRYRIPRFATPVDGGFEFKSPMMQVVLNDGYLFRAGQTDWGEERKTDVFLYYTQRIDGTERIKLPGGYHVVEPPFSDEVDETYAYFKGTSSLKSGKLTITGIAEVRRRQIPPDGYAGFKRAMDEARGWGDTSYRIEKGGRS
jgi:hypothetical protein